MKKQLNSCLKCNKEYDVRETGNTSFCSLECKLAYTDSKKPHADCTTIKDFGGKNDGV